MIKLPKEITYAEVYLTLRCNLKCDYCLNRFDSPKLARIELDASKLITAVNNINFGDVPLTLGGGEPSLHPDFYTILNEIHKTTKIDILTNLRFDIKEFISKTSPSRFTDIKNDGAYKSIRVSYHPSQMDPQTLIDRARELQDAGYSIGVFGISHPENTIANIKMSEIARKAQIYFFIKDFLGWYKGQLFGFYKYPEALAGTVQNEKVLCRSTELLIAPNGDIHRCHYDLYNNQPPVDNITNKDLNLEYTYRPCIKFGLCHPCDIKIKANRFLSMGVSSVEINEYTG